MKKITNVEHRSDGSAKVLFYLVLVFLCLTSLGALLLSTLSFDRVRAWLDASSVDGSADAFTVAVYDHAKMLLRCIFVLGLGSVGTVILFRNYLQNAIACRLFELGRLFISATNVLRRLPRRFYLSGIAIAAVFAFMAIPFMDEPIRYDEAHTYVNYVAQPLVVTVTKYDAPNNHILHSILAKISTSVFGESVQAFRIPAFVSCLALVVLVFAAGWIWVRPAIGVGASLLLAANPTLIEAAGNARGHVLAALLIAKAAFLLECARRSDDKFWLRAFASLNIALALYAVPTALYGLIALFVWELLQYRQATQVDSLDKTLQSDQLRSVVRYPGLLAHGVTTCCPLIAGFLLAGVLYVPVFISNPIHQVTAIASTQVDRMEILQKCPEYLVELWKYYTWDIEPVPQILLGFFGIVFAIECIRSLLGGGIPVSRAFGFLLMFCAPFAFMIIHGTLPPVRTLVFLIPVFCLACAVGMERAFSLRSERAAGVITVFICVSLFGVLGFQTFKERAISTSERHAVVREAEQVATWLHQNALPKQPIIAVTPESATLAYYFVHNRWNMTHFLVPGRGETSDEQGLVVTHAKFQDHPREVLQNLDLSSLFDAESATVATRIGETTIWNVPGK